MNGRIYDPLLGRFLSADLMVQDTADLGSYNRYSYVRNRPLSAIDPTGWSDVSPLNGKGINAGIPSRPFDAQKADYQQRAQAAGIMDFFSRSAIGTMSMLAHAGANGGPTGDISDPAVHARIDSAAAQFEQGARDFASDLYGVPDGDLDRRMADGTTELTLAVLGIGAVLENAALRLSAVNPSEIASDVTSRTARQLDTKPTPAVEIEAPKPRLKDSIETALEVRDEAGTALTRAQDNFASATKNLESAKQEMSQAGSLFGDGPELTAATEVFENAEEVMYDAQDAVAEAMQNWKRAQEEMLRLGRQ